MRVLRHTITVLLARLLIVGVPVFRTGYIQRRLSGADTVSSATVVIDQPSNACVVLINRGRHPDRENLEVWEQFFRGEEIGILFEDISCVVADTDPAGLETAISFQRRLPENQMTIRKEDLTLMRSKADQGLYDVMLLSRGLYEATGADRTASPERDDMIETRGESETETEGGNI